MNMRLPRSTLVPRLYVCVGLISAFSPACVREEKKGDVYRDFHRAIRTGDTTAAEALLSTAAVAEMKKTGLDLRGALGLVKELMPPEYLVSRDPTKDKPDTLVLEGASPGWEGAKGTITFVREGGRLKIAKVDWKMVLKGDGTATAQGGYDPKYSVALTGIVDAPELGRIESRYLEVGPTSVAVQPAAFFKGRSHPVVPGRTWQEEAEFDHLRFSPRGDLLIGASYGDFSVVVWETFTWGPVKKFKREERPTGLDMAQTGEAFVAGDVYSNLTFWPLTGRTVGEPQSVNADAGKHLKIAVSPNSKLVATASFDKILSLWSLAERRQLAKINSVYPLASVAFSPAGPLLAAGTGSNKLILWDLRTGGGKVYVIPKVDPGSAAVALAFSPDGKFLATGHTDSSITVWEVGNLTPKHNYYVSQASTAVVAYSPAGDVLATGHEDGTIHIWDRESAAELAVLREHRGAVLGLAFSPDGQSLASSGRDKKIVAWR